MSTRKYRGVWVAVLVALISGLCALGPVLGVCAAQEQQSDGLEITGELPELSQPAVITSLGQTPGTTMLRILCRQLKITAVQSDMLTASEFREAGKDPNKAYKTLIITMGTSLKGMGAAGVDVDSEVTRVNAVISAARELGIPVIGVQIEGSSRRTDEFDEKSNRTVAPQADLLIIRKEVNYDNYFTNVAQEKNIPIVLVNQAIDFGYVFGLLFPAPAK